MQSKPDGCPDRRNRNATWQRFTQRLLRYARALRHDPADAEDLVQECLLHMLAREARNGLVHDVERYLLSSLRNLHITTRRRRLRQRSVIENTAPEPVCRPAQIARLEVEETVRDLQSLPPSQSRTLLLAALEENDCRRVGAQLGVSVGTVRSRVSRARSALRARRENQSR